MCTATMPPGGIYLPQTLANKMFSLKSEAQVKILLATLHAQWENDGLPVARTLNDYIEHIMMSRDATNSGIQDLLRLGYIDRVLIKQRYFYRVHPSLLDGLFSQSENQTQGQSENQTAVRIVDSGQSENQTAVRIVDSGQSENQTQDSPKIRPQSENQTALLITGPAKDGDLSHAHIHTRTEDLLSEIQEGRREGEKNNNNILPSFLPSISPLQSETPPQGDELVAFARTICETAGLAYSGVNVTFSQQLITVYWQALRTEQRDLLSCVLAFHEFSQGRNMSVNIQKLDIWVRRDLGLEPLPDGTYRRKTKVTAPPAPVVPVRRTDNGLRPVAMSTLPSDIQDKMQALPPALQAKIAQCSVSSAKA